jgi:site-specific DNA recombinase
MKEILHIYMRVSSQSQVDDGTSMETQKEIGIRKSTELGLDYKIWDEGGQSSSKDDLSNRPVLTQLLDKVEQGEVKHLFVYNTDRLSRNEETWMFIRLKLKKNEVILYTTYGQHDLNNPLDKLLFGILQEISSYDNSLRTERTRLGKVNRIKQGFWMGGPTPFGYEIKDKKLVPNKNESKWVQFIFEEYSNRKSLREIKLSLLKNGVLTRRGNSVWSLGSIEKLLSNTHYGGFYHVKDHKTGEVVRVECPPIITNSLIRKVQTVKESRTRQTRVSESNLKTFYLLREFLFCSECGSRYSGRTFPKQYRSIYYCPRMERKFVNEGNDKNTKCPNRRYLKIEETDKLVWDTVIEVISNSHLFKEEIKKQVLGQHSLSSQKDELVKLKSKHKKIQTEINDVNTSIVNLETDVILKRRNSSELQTILKNVEGIRQKLESDKEELERKISSIMNRTKWVDWISEFGERINKMSEFTIEEKYKFLKGVLERIQVKTLDTQSHELKVHFLIPYVKDSVMFKDSKDKKKGYIVKNGKKEVTIPLYSSKK